MALQALQKKIVMIYIIGKRTDSITYEILSVVLSDIEDKISLFFQNKSYSNKVDEINVDLVYSRYYQAPYRKRPIYHEDKTAKVFPHDPKNDATFRMHHLLLVDIPLSEEISTCNEDEAVAIIGETMVNYFKNVALPVKIRNSFDKERFISDLQSFFATYKQKT